MNPHPLLATLLDGTTLDEPSAEEAIGAILEGRLDAAQIAALLSLIQARGATVDELVGGARAMRRHVTPVPFDEPGTIILDTCGTGGAPKTFNVSTVVALVTAAAGSTAHAVAPGSPRVVVAKHGNRSRTGRGSAEVLAALGVNVDATPEVQARCLREAGVCFCFAIHHHPAARHAAPVRRALGFPTLFNLLGPLTNPARASRQLLGVYDARAARLVAEALARLGSERAIVLHSQDGLDEISLSAPTTLVHVEHGRTREESIDPATFGVPRATVESLTARDLDHATAIVRDVLADQPGPTHDIVRVNTAAALLAAGVVTDFGAGLVLAREAIASGAAASTLASIARVSRE
ncbi:MAG: anthranilate phosphoribosyltransferase [Phycisphaerales bacterium]